VTLIFALLGTINRMRFSSDANVQKALGLVTDTWGAATLTWTLAHFHLRCFAGLPARHGALELEHAWGPAWVCYLVCCLSGIIRAAAHWVTPTPGNGAGACVFSLPQRILRVLDRAGQESEIPNFKGSFLGRFPLVSADFWTSDHLSERSRSVDAFSGTIARGTLTLKRR
jgi:hypothetical protein